MDKISEKQIRACFVNASRSEAAKLTLPADFQTLEWDRLDFLGWRDEKMPQRGYLVSHAGDRLVGLMLRAPQGGNARNRKVLCELCRDVFSEEDVYLWVAKRAGQPGRDGNTLGTLICAQFLCSANVRKEPPASDIEPDPAVVVDRQIRGLRERTGKFVARVRA
ncbi:FBP domain-containing protein [Paeniglutamicibacter antarcticus]|uniref:FBP domain-containing protein n=1 Tax=Arthrobacter terrae TaxID=2935737 RepID=A0A931CN36_9MICC|nr:FBP domain-containing protein [Arthrobacter terrae]MBG0737874.1 FBP domain-containing protein [Arthrobacter terrae]